MPKVIIYTQVVKEVHMPLEDYEQYLARTSRLDGMRISDSMAINKIASKYVENVNPTGITVFNLCNT